MTEAQWLAGTNPEKMLAFVLAEEPLWPLRLLRLFARPRKPPSARKLRLFLCAFLRQYANSDLDEAAERARGVAEKWTGGEATVMQSTGEKATPRAIHYIQNLFNLFCRTPKISSIARNNGNLIRHMFGNPFRAYPPRASWPVSVVDLANTLYAGQDCAPVLADALEESGHAALGEHMRSEQSHPKGCWVLDLILGKS